MLKHNNYQLSRGSPLILVKKRSREGDIVTKWAKRNSFFNFFTPPKLENSHRVRRRLSSISLPHNHHHLEPSSNSQTPTSIADMQKLLLLEAHFKIGLYLKDTFIPKAFLFFVDSPAALAGNNLGKRR